MRDLARAIGAILAVSMVGAIADEQKIAAVRILAAKAVTAAGRGRFRRRSGFDSRSRDRVMQTRDRFPIGDIENDPDHGGLRAKVQAKHMVIGTGGAEEARLLPSLPRARGREGWRPLDWLEISTRFRRTATPRRDCWRRVRRCARRE
jgi:hypothetical protein